MKSIVAMALSAEHHDNYSLNPLNFHYFEGAIGTIKEL